VVPIDAAEAGSTSDDMGLSVFEPIIERLRRSGAAKIIPLHQGKTVFTTPVELREWGRD